MNILLISGHGAGDPGAMSTIDGVTYKEADETRRVTSALQKALQPYCGVDVYPVGRNAFKDCNNGTLHTMAGFGNYNYVLEIHFNAYTQNAYDGKTKGVECYVTTTESKTTIEEKICKEISSVGLTNRGVKRYNWAVIKSAKRSGVSSALLEVCFIDDPDDMKVYNSKFQEIVNGIAKAIVEGFGLGEFKMESNEEEDNMVIYKTYEDLPNWAKPTVQKLVKKCYLTGEGDGVLNLEENMLRVLVINDRAGLYDIK